MTASLTRTSPLESTTSKRPAGTLYRGREGMWSWVLHRITGVAIFFFLLVHVLDTALVRVSPEAYNAVIGTYKNPIMGLGETALVAAIAFHALQRHPHHPDRLLDARAPSTSGSCSRSSSGCGSCDARLRAAPPDQRLQRDGPLMTHRSPLPAPPLVPRAVSGVNWEKWGWIYMRASGVVLVVLIFGHLFVNLMLGDGIKAIDFAFVGGKLVEPVLAVCGTSLMLWLALIHGGNGMRTIVNDYATSRTIRAGPQGRDPRRRRRPHRPRHPAWSSPSTRAPPAQPADLLASFCPAQLSNRDRATETVTTRRPPSPPSSTASTTTSSTS